MQANVDISQELKELGLDLPIVGNPMKVPDNYLANFTTQLFQELETMELELNFSKNNPYKVPANYLENFKVGLLQRDNKLNKINKSGSLKLNWKTISIAASLAILLAVGINSDSFFANNKITDFSTLENISDLELKNYVSEVDSDLESSDALQIANALKQIQYDQISQYVTDEAIEITTNDDNI
jgi:hypothetical protein